MTYEIYQAEPPQMRRHIGPDRTEERLTMERLAVGEAFMLGEATHRRRAIDAARYLRPKVFTVRKIPGRGWEVQRVA